MWGVRTAKGKNMNPTDEINSTDHEEFGVLEEIDEPERKIRSRTWPGVIRGYGPITRAIAEEH